MRGRSRSVPLTIVALAACASLPSSGDDVPDVIEVAARAETVVDTIWPGFRPIERGFIVYEPSAGAWLVSDHAPPEPWVAVSSDVPRLRGRLYRRATDLPGLTGGIDTSYRLGDRTYTAVGHDRELADDLATLFHESFHAWQAETFGDFESQHAPPAVLTAEQVAGAELERRVLIAALRANGRSADSLVAAFLSIRRERMAALPEDVRRIEPSLERLEGTAHLVGITASVAARDGSVPDPRARVTENLIRTLEQDLAVYGADPAAQYRWRAYGTGSAMGALLDRLGVDWRARVQAGATLDSVLVATAPVQPSSVLAGRARERFGFAELLRHAETIAVPRPADPIADFLARATHRLVIDVDAQPDQSLGMSFTPGPGFSTPAPSVVLMESVSEASITTPGFDMTVEDRPLLLDGREAPRVRITILLPSAPRVDGRPPASVSGPLAGVVAVTGEDVELTIRGEHLLSIAVDGDVVTVRLRPE